MPILMMMGVSDGAVITATECPRDGCTCQLVYCQTCEGYYCPSCVGGCH